MTESSHLRNAFLTKPHATNQIMARYMGDAGETPMHYLTTGTGRKEEIGNIEYEYYLDADDERAIRVMSNLEGGTANPGLGHATMRVVFKDRWFSRSDVLNPDDSSRRYQVFVCQEPQPYQGHWLYTLQLVNPDSTLSMPAALIAAGARFSKEFSAHSEFDKPSDTTFGTFVKLRNNLTTLFKSYTVSRSAATDVIEFIFNAGNKSKTYWIHTAEWKFMKQYYKELERQYWFSTYNRKPNGEVAMKSGGNRPVYVGAGIRDQIAPANKREYTSLTKDVILEFLADLSYNVKDESDRHFVAFTGEFGFIEFDRALKDEASTFRAVDQSKFVGGEGQSLILQGQFTQYKGPNGITLTLKKLPLYDNLVTEREVHWKSGRPLSSYRFTILDFGMKEGKSNIMKMYKKDSEFISWHTAGSIDPMGNPGKSISTQRSSGEDGYSVFCLSESNIKIANPLSCGELICTASA
jgi:hypothetical protein